MTYTYTWAITRLALTTVKDVKDYVVQSYWTCTGEDADGDTGTFNGATPFHPDPNQTDITPYEELTEAQVLGWIQDAVKSMPGYMQNIDQTIAKQIALKKDPVVDTTTFPWSPPEEPKVP